MVVALQIISKIINTHDASIIDDNYLGVEHFVGFTAEFEFIQNHREKYGNVPDKTTFLASFPDFEIVDVNETDAYLVSTLREEYLYYQSIPVIEKAAELVNSDANAAAEYLMSQMSTLQPQYEFGGIDIIANAQKRYNEYIDRKEHQSEWYFESGFQELDEITHGLQRGEELFVIIARLNQGKSWVLGKICSHVWKTGFNVGYVSPEMTASSIGFRFDTLFKNFSNKGLMWGKDDSADAEYQEYINDLKTRTNKFMVATPMDFGNQITVSKLRTWVKRYKLDMIAVDGIKYIVDERARKSDNETAQLTHVSEDLMNLSIELKIPVVVVAQCNRNGVIGKDVDEGTPELESISSSDGIGQNASKVIAIRQKANNVLEIGIKKQRFGAVGGKLNYTWNIDTGEFTFIPSYDDAQSRKETQEKVSKVRKDYKDKKDVF